MGTHASAAGSLAAGVADAPGEGLADEDAVRVGEGDGIGD
jgi:hypothetical protein